MLIATEDLTVGVALRAAAACRPRAAVTKKSFFRTPLTSERVLDPPVRNPTVLDRVHQGLERLRLHVGVVLSILRHRAANEDAVATGCNRLYGRFCHAVVTGQGR